MKTEFLPTSDTISAMLTRLVNKSSEIFCAVAWATENPLSKTLIKSENKIQRLVIGTCFYQTDPKILAKLQHLDQLRIATNRRKGVFHPKIYLFFSKNEATAIIGSANFTNNGLTCNDEAALCVTGSSEEEIFKEIKESIEDHYRNGLIVDDEFLESYTRQYKAMQAHRNALAGSRPVRRPARDALHPELLSLDWDGFVDRVKNDQFHDYDKRINVLNESRHLFLQYDQFLNMPRSVRRAISGLLTEGLPHLDDNPNSIFFWGWFGSMTGSGEFQNRINENDEYISIGLSCIPSLGEVNKDHYDAYIENFVMAFDGRKRKGGIATASRLLTMKRPDLFVCVNDKNKRDLCKDLGCSPTTLDFDKYWSHIIEPITEAVWWQCRGPNGRNGVIWDYRSAMLNAIYYNPN